MVTIIECLKNQAIYNSVIVSNAILMITNLSTVSIEYRNKWKNELMTNENYKFLIKEIKTNRKLIV